MALSKTRIKVTGRLAFPVLNKPEQFKGQGAYRYSGNIIIMDETGKKQTIAAMKAAAVEEWPKDGEQKLKDFFRVEKTCLIDGSTKPEVSGFDGNWVLRANAPDTTPPSLYRQEGGRNVRVENESQTLFYAGCWVEAIVEIYAQNNKWGQRINAVLSGLKFIRDDAPFGGGAVAREDEFDIIDEAEEPDFDDDGSEGDNSEPWD